MTGLREITSETSSAYSILMSNTNFQRQGGSAAIFGFDEYPSVGKAKNMKLDAADFRGIAKSTIEGFARLHLGSYTRTNRLELRDAKVAEA